MTVTEAKRRKDCRPTEVSEYKAKPDRSRAIKTGHLDKLGTELAWALAVSHGALFDGSLRLHSSPASDAFCGTSPQLRLAYYW